MSPRAQRRPLPVTLAVALVALNGLMGAGLGVLVLLSRYDVPADDVLTVSLVGAGVTLTGLLIVAVAAAIGRGSRLSRILLTVYLAILVVLQVLTIETTEPWDVGALVQIGLAVLVVVIVWTPPGSRHFRTAADPDALTPPEPSAPGSAAGSAARAR